MTAETKTDHSADMVDRWAPKAHRLGESPDWANPPRVTQEDEDVLVLPMSPPPTWPRIFPGL